MKGGDAQPMESVSKIKPVDGEKSGSVEIAEFRLWKPPVRTSFLRNKNLWLKYGNGKEKNLCFRFPVAWC